MSRTLLLAALLLPLSCLPARAQQDGSATDKDIWRQADLGEVDYAKQKNYCVRLFGYYRCVDDGVAYGFGREDRLYRVTEGITAIDVRYKKKTDDGSITIASRNLVHPDEAAEASEFFEITPYTFLEKACRNPKHFTMSTRGDTTTVTTRRGQAGIIVADTAARELLMDYNALAPDTSLSLNILILKARLSDVQAQAVYDLGDDDGRRPGDSTRYVPQGSLKRITFDGNVRIDFHITVHVEERFREHYEFYVDSVAYLTRDEYRADKRQRSETALKAYTPGDIDRLKQKHHVPPLTAEQLARIEDQRDWEDMTEQWSETNRAVRAAKRYGETMDRLMESNESLQRMQQNMQQAIDKAVENGTQKRTELEQ